MNAAELKALIHEAASGNPEIGPLEESLKWGEPSFTPVRRNVGSSVRIAERGGGDLALMFICHTNLVEEFRELYPAQLAFEGNRAIVIAKGDRPDREALSHCIALALTYKLRSKRANR